MRPRCRRSEVATPSQELKVLISRSTLLDLVLRPDEGIHRLFEELQQEPQPCIPYLTDRALADFQKLLAMEPGVDAAALVQHFYDHFQVMPVTLPHVRTANTLNWPDLERAIDYAVAIAEKLDMVVFLDPVEAQGTQELILTVTPDGLLKRLELEQVLAASETASEAESGAESEAESEISDRDLLSQVLLCLVKGVFGETAGQVQPAPPPTAIGEAVKAVKADASSHQIVRHGPGAGALTEPSYLDGLQLQVKIGDQDYPLRVYGPSLAAIVREKEAERDALRAELAERQEALDALNQELETFDTQFKQQVGVLYVELLNLKALYWREQYGFDPTLEMILKGFYEEARRRQQEVYGDAFDAHDSMWGDWESFKAGQGSAEAKPKTGWAEDLTRHNDPRLKQLRRRILKLIAPDYVMATGDPELIRRCTELTQRVNAAVAAGDLATLERIEAEVCGFLDAAACPSLRVRLQQVLAEIARLRQHLAEVVQEIAQRQESDTYQLLQDLRQRQESVPTFLARQVQDLTAQIAAVREQLRQFRQQKAAAQGE